MPSGTVSAAHATPATVLRYRTRGAHERVEARVDAPARLADRAAYRTWLERLHGFHAATDACLDDRFADAGLAPSGRVDRRERDLAALGASAAEIATLPRLHPGWIDDDPAVPCVDARSAVGGRRGARRLRGLRGLRGVGVYVTPDLLAPSTPVDLDNRDREPILRPRSLLGWRGRTLPPSSRPPLQGAA